MNDTLFISIDGACRRNGQSDCVSAGGVFINDNNQYMTLSAHEYNSTNQRGEIKALILAIEYLNTFTNKTALVITDSEYLFNAMTKRWYVSWQSRGWLTASMEPVKNQDLWETIQQLTYVLEERNNELVFYHIKGHCISLGKVTAKKLLEADESGKLLYDAAKAKFVGTTLKADKLAAIQELSTKNNGYVLDDAYLEVLITMNTVVDVVASSAADLADTLSRKR